MFKISDKELEDLLALADDRECEKLTRARGYDDTLNEIPRSAREGFIWQEVLERRLFENGFVGCESKWLCF